MTEVLPAPPSPAPAKRREPRPRAVAARAAEGAGRHGFTVTVVLVAVALGCALVSFSLGPSPYSLGEMLAGLFTGDGVVGTIAREIRLPRAALALVVGAALGASGAALQGLFRNPLAEPGITGVTSCAGLGAVIALYFGIAAVFPLALPMFAIAGALGSAALLYLLARRGAGTLALVLAGVAIASLAAALTALTLSLAQNPYAMTEMVLWLMGSLKDRTLADLAFAAPLVAVGIALLVSSARALDALTLGEDAAASLGIDIARARVHRGRRYGACHRRRDRGGGRGRLRRLGRAASVAAVLRPGAGPADPAVGARRRGAGGGRRHRRAFAFAVLGWRALARCVHGASGRAVLLLADREIEG